MKIGNLDLRQKRLLIAEIGNNHEGDAHLALELVDAAAAAGAQAVKVQVINPEKLVNRSQTERIAQLTRFRLPLAVMAEMAARARTRGLLFIASAFDEDSLLEVAPFLSAIKIASADLDFHPLLIRAAAQDKPIILSTGMATLTEVREAVNLIQAHLPPPRLLNESLALLHCVSLYPTPLQLANLKAIHTLRNEFHLPTGYSDHCLGMESALVALALGARIIEKHFTLDKTRQTFRDHALSADPRDLQRLAEVMAAFDDLLGKGKKNPGAEELSMAAVARRAIVAARDLTPGERLLPADLEFVRPREGGLPPAAAAALVGRRLRVPLKCHQQVLESYLDPRDED
jgi:N-acetylneuraminate synthase/N,N'-diacetyllegionaminate synthase